MFFRFNQQAVRRPAQVLCRRCCAVIMPKQKKTLPWIWRGKPKPDLPNLTRGQKSQITDQAGAPFSAKDWEAIERARRIYHQRRWAKPQAPEYADFARRLKNFADGAEGHILVSRF